MITPTFGLTATERVLPKLALDFTTAVLDARVTVTRTTNATNPATYIDSSGVITAATNNQPRFDYDPATLLCRGLLIEESRTNSLLNTDLLATQTVTVTAAARTLSFYGAGSITLSGAHVAVVSGTGAYPTRTTYSFTPSAGALTLTVAGTVQFAQLEAGAFATSYIPTTTTSLTRNADVVSMTGTNFSSWFNTSEGSLMFQGDTLTVANPNNMTLASFYLNGSNYIRYWMWQGQPANLRYTVVASGAGSADIVNAITANTQFKVMSSYATNLFRCAFNGAAASVDTSGAVPTGLTTFYIGSLDSVNEPFNGHVAKINYYSQSVTSGEVQAFSK